MIWVLVNDDRVGAIKPARALAQSLARRLNYAMRVLPVTRTTAWGTVLPSCLFSPAPSRYNAALAPPWPRITVSCGWRVAQAALAIKCLAGSAVYSIQIHPPPRMMRRCFDAIITSTGDGLQSHNVYPIIGMPEAISSSPLSTWRRQSITRYAHLPRPVTTVLIGGANRALRLTHRGAASLIQSLQDALQKTGGSYLVTLSRRSPPFLLSMLRERWRHLPGEVWDQTGKNPYEEYLAQADYIAVTADSINMLSEACAAGKPVFILPLERRWYRNARKHTRFHDDLVTMRHARFFRGEFFDWPCVRLDETRRLADRLAPLIEGRGPPRSIPSS